MGAVAVDVVIIGGGIQGLLILDRLSAAGYACALVTEGDIGAGQTLHSHGFLNSGAGLWNDELPRAAAALVHPDLRERGVPLRGDWVVLPPSALPNLPSAAIAALQALPLAHLPGGFSAVVGAGARALPDRSVCKRQVVERLLRGREERVIRGSIAGFRGRDPVSAVLVQPEGSAATVDLRTGVVVVAAGCGSKRLLRALGGASCQLERIKHRLVHMLCLRAPSGALPATSVIALSLGLLLAAHDDGQDVTWYVSPLAIGGPSSDDVPNDAAGRVYPAVLARTSIALLSLYPTLPETAGLRVGQYAGYRQDVGDLPGQRLCAPLVGARNVIAALPSGLIGPWLNAVEVLALVRGLTTPSGAQPTLPGGGDHVRVGCAVEDRPGFVWKTWEGWTNGLRGSTSSALDWS